MTLDDATELLHAIARLQAKPLRLNKSQLQVFAGSWNGKSYQEIADEYHLNHEYVKQIGSKLWSMLSRALGEPVSKLNLQSAMARYGKALRSDVLETAESAVEPVGVRHNLPEPDYPVFVGRHEELSQVLQALSPDAIGACISLVGSGGMGKTALALAAAHSCLQAQNFPENLNLPQFEAIIFTSAKQYFLTAQTILPRSRYALNLQDIFRAIARTLKRPELLRNSESDIEDAILEALSQQRSLLIIDNLETLADVNPVLAFLRELPHTVKAIITSRHDDDLFTLIRLKPLSPADSWSLIQRQAKLKAFELTSRDAETLVQQTSGIPAAMVYAVGQLVSGYPIASVPQKLTLSGSDYCRFYFESSMVHLKGKLPHQVLMAIALFAESASSEAIAYIVDSTSTATTQALVQLQQFSLIHQHHGRVSMLPLTQEYVLSELSAYPEIEGSMRDRWITWYLYFVHTHGGKDWKDWHDFSEFEPEWGNLRDVIQWCIGHDRYDAVRQFWHQVKAYAHSLGYRGDRLTYWAMGLDWTTWLLAAAEQRQDWATALDIMADQSWTLTLLNQPAQAAELYAKAWELRQYKDLEFQSNLAIHRAYLFIKQAEWDNANSWLNKAEDLLNQLEHSPGTVRSHVELAYYRGTLCYKLERFNDAQYLFEAALQLAQSINWQRAIYLTQDFLADIAIAQHQLAKAEALLTDGLNAAKTNQDECRMAYCERSLARLEWQRDQREAALNYAIASHQKFQHLGMHTEAQEAADLLEIWAL
jgi:NB-ARC domain